VKSELKRLDCAEKELRLRRKGDPAKVAMAPPGSIAEFATRYSAREFDGRSDECLKETWPLKK